ncbi:MAG: hypothetical protein OXF99_00225 [bacterium]|nr:hypothetical protein [bacterium]
MAGHAGGAVGEVADADGGNRAADGLVDEGGETGADQHHGEAEDRGGSAGHLAHGLECQALAQGEECHHAGIGQAEDGDPQNERRPSTVGQGQGQHGASCTNL